MDLMERVTRNIGEGETFSPLHVLVFLNADLEKIQDAYERDPEALTKDIIFDACRIGAKPGVIPFLVIKFRWTHYDEGDEDFFLEDDVHNFPIHYVLWRALHEGAEAVPFKDIKMLLSCFIANVSYDPEYGIPCCTIRHNSNGGLTYRGLQFSLSAALLHVGNYQSDVLAFLFSWLDFEKDEEGEYMDLEAFGYHCHGIDIFIEVRLHRNKNEESILLQLKELEEQCNATGTCKSALYVFDLI